MLILIYGSDALRVKERVADMKLKFKEKFDPTGMNLDDFSYENGQTERGMVTGALQSSPFLAEKRMVVVRGLLSGLKKADAALWKEILLSVPSSTIAIFVEIVESAKFVKQEVYKIITAAPDVHVYPLLPLEGSAFSSWAAERTRLQGVVISPALLNKLAERVSYDTWRLDAELQKLAAYANGAGVNEAMIQDLVARDVEENIFAFLDALSAKGNAKALAKLSDERRAGTGEFQLFGMLVRQIRLLLEARDVMDSKAGVTKNELATALGLHPYVAQKILGEARSWQREQLLDLHALAFDLDKAAKSGLAPELAVDRLVAAILTRR